MIKKQNDTGEVNPSYIVPSLSLRKFPKGEGWPILGDGNPVSCIKLCV